MNNMTLPLPNPGDWMTVNAAAAVLSVDRRTVSRMIAKSVLTAHRPYSHPAEKAPTLLWRDQVLEVLSARARMAGAKA